MGHNYATPISQFLVAALSMVLIGMTPPFNLYMKFDRDAKTEKSHRIPRIKLGLEPKTF